MTKDDKIKIKIEVCRDQTSGKLSIMAHFNSNAPNVHQDKDGYVWVPTVEEKDFIAEAFELMPVGGSITSHDKPSPKLEEPKDVKLSPKIEEEIDELPTTIPKEDKKESLSSSSPEKQDDPSAFEVTGEDTKKDDFSKEIEKEIEEALPKTEEPPKDDKKSDEKTDKKEIDEGLIVEADSDAIEAALNKHNANDETIVEVDEQTIVDKVLSQKKKGKWSRK